MRQPPSCRAPRHGPLAATICLVSVLAGPLLGAGVACADPVPLPTVDFALSADLRRGGSMDLAHSQGRMRVEMVKPNVPGSIVGIIDLKARRMVVRTPNLPNMAVEIELPPEYALGILNGTGLRVGEGQVAGEPCDLWKLDAPLGAAGGAAMGASVGPTTACITPDGIALRTEVEVQGKKQTVFEALKLTRAPQDPKLFQLPAGVQVIKVPKGKIGSALGLPGLGAPLLDLAPKP
ncbi:hypothetical protein [Xanthobacter autotrophicus]|uniref:hypothetical protein n=1 Tax=Xanthobacter autotrophicus TaxID=280 RepID=UPI0024A6B0D5|nr:hypothetical protein [Xanthobacter autotrophicus]MDI4656346.1 hypothetical protein [Xanthobacter autotrophicus]